MKQPSIGSVGFSVGYTMVAVVVELLLCSAVRSAVVDTVIMCLFLVKGKLG